MTIDDVLNNTSSAPLTNEEINILSYACYVIKADTPQRIKDNPTYVRHCIFHFLNRLDLSCINFSDQAIRDHLQHLEVSAKLKLLDRMEKENLDPGLVDPNGFYRNVAKFPHAKTIASVMDMCNPENGWQCAVIHDAALDELTVEERAMVEKVILRYNVSFERLPCALTEDREFMGKYVQTAPDPIYQEEVDIFTTSTYDEDIEKRFAESYGCKTVEEVAQVIATEYPELQNHLALATIKLYTLKYLHEHGVDDVPFHIYKDPEALTEQASYSPVKNEICMTRNTRQNPTFMNLVLASIHEATHALQYKNMLSMNYNEDPDIDLYTKDDFLATSIKGYYEDNYTVVSQEYDADMTARIHNMNVLGVSKEMHAMLREFALNKYMSTRQILNHVPGEKAYSFNVTRKKQDEEKTLIPLEDYVAEVLNQQIRSAPDFDTFYQALQEKHPLLCYEYSITPEGATKRSPQQLVEQAISAQTEKEQEIYEYLIRSSVTQRKTRSAETNAMSYHLMTLDPNTPQEVIDLINRNVSQPSNGKYIEKIEDRTV